MSLEIKRDNKGRFIKGGPSPCGMKNKHHNKKAKERMRVAHLGKRYKIMSTEGRENIRLAHLGKHPSEETKNKLREILKIKGFQKGHIPWSKGKQGIHSEATLEKIRQSKIGNNNPMYGKRGKDCPNWKGRECATALQVRIKNSAKYREWRNEVLKRDNHICQNCNYTEVELEIHHKNEIALILLLNDITTFEQAMVCSELWDINNGETLCKDCHNLTKRGQATLERNLIPT